MKICIWCKGNKTIMLKSYGIICCPNCKGTGQGKDGGGKGAIISRSRPYMIGNQYGRRNNEALLGSKNG
jgi:hypothetical protein